MPCHAMHPIQDLFLESFSYALQFDKNFYMHSYVDKKFILVKSGCYKGSLALIPRLLLKVLHVKLLEILEVFGS
jgi:hypothetical protein